jgi:hypothetical protein
LYTALDTELGEIWSREGEDLRREEEVALR